MADEEVKEESVEEEAPKPKAKAKKAAKSSGGVKKLRKFREE